MYGRFPYQHLHKYPRLMPEDRAIWERFILKYPDIFETADYDMLVGDGVIVHDCEDDCAKQNYANLTKKRIDCVGYTHDAIHVIEVKPSAPLGTLGQVLGYKTLFEYSYMPDLPVYPVIITDVYNGDMHKVCQQYGVKIYSV